MSIKDAYATLNKCRTVAKDKGDAGEQILISLAKDYQKIHKCTILWSYSYPYQSDRDGITYTGNIKKHDGKYEELTKEGYNDEIDVVIITDYRIFVVECKARSGKWVLYDHWARQNGSDVDKSPITQCEKHARHLYHLIHEWIPDGKPEYITPITAFVDKCELTDKRGKPYRKYIQVSIANNFKRLIKFNDTPLEYRIIVNKLVNYMLQHGEAKRVYR